MKTKVKVFRWNEVKNTSEIIVAFFDNTKKVNSSDIELMKIVKETIKKELV